MPQKAWPFSMAKLYVADIDKLVEIDINEAKIIGQYPAKNAAFLNDVTVCKNGMIFVSDSQTGKIYLFENQNISEFPLEPVKGINGLCAANGKLYLGSGKIQELDIQTKELKVLFEDAGGIDGLERMDDGKFHFFALGRTDIHNQRESNNQTSGYFGRRDQQR